MNEWYEVGRGHDSEFRLYMNKLSSKAKSASSEIPLVICGSGSNCNAAPCVTMWHVSYILQKNF